MDRARPRIEGYQRQMQKAFEKRAPGEARSIPKALARGGAKAKARTEKNTRSIAAGRLLGGTH